MQARISHLQYTLQANILLHMSHHQRQEMQKIMHKNPTAKQTYEELMSQDGREDRGSYVMGWS